MHTRRNYSPNLRFMGEFKEIFDCRAKYILQRDIAAKSSSASTAMIVEECSISFPSEIQCKTTSQAPPHNNLLLKVCTSSVPMVDQIAHVSFILQPQPIHPHAKPRAAASGAPPMTHGWFCSHNTR